MSLVVRLLPRLRGRRISEGATGPVGRVTRRRAVPVPVSVPRIREAGATPNATVTPKTATGAAARARLRRAAVQSPAMLRPPLARLAALGSVGSLSENRSKHVDTPAERTGTLRYRGVSDNRCR